MRVCGELFRLPCVGIHHPAHRFVHEVLHHFKVALHELAPNRVQRLAAFVALCERYLGIDPHFDLFTYFFTAALVKPRCGTPPSPWVFCSIQMEETRVLEYPCVKLSTSNKEWHRGWFYLKNRDDGRLPEFSLNHNIPTEDPPNGGRGPCSMLSWGCRTISPALPVSKGTASRGRASSTSTIGGGSPRNGPTPALMRDDGRGGQHGLAGVYISATYPSDEEI